MKIFKKIIISILLVVTVCIGAAVVQADMGTKPSIIVHLQNMDTEDYTIDLLTRNNKEDFYNKINSQYIGYKDTPIYKYDKGGWMATALREELLWGEIYGNREKTHTFTYFGTPTEFKVIIQFKDGKTKVSDVFVRKVLTYNIYIDVNTMSSLNDDGSDQKLTLNYMSLFKCLILTVSLELLLAWVMKIHYPKTIIIVNIITQIFFQIALLRNFSNYLTSFVILEIAIVIVEYLIYRKIFTRVTNKRLMIYTIIANFITAYLTFMII